MTDLVAWLRVQFDEDERVARVATPGPWLPPIGSGDLGYVWRDDDGRFQVAIAVDDNEDANATHIARHDPARVLAEVAAKRAILEAHGNGDAWCDHCSDWAFNVSDQCPTIRLLAQPFAGQPGWPGLIAWLFNRD